MEVWGQQVKRFLMRMISGARDVTGAKKAEEGKRRNQKEAQRLAEENRIMAEIGRIISSSPNIEEVYEGFAAEVHKLIPFDRIAINLINKDGVTLINRFVKGDLAAGRNTGEVFPTAGTVTQALIQNRKGLIIDIQNETGIAAKYPGLLPEMKAGFRSFLSVPLISRDQSIGGLHFRSKTSQIYSEKDLKLAENIAVQISGAIANARLYSDLKEAKETFQKKEEEFRELYDYAPLGYHEYNREGKITRVNKTDLELLGYSLEEMIGQPIWKFNVEEDLAQGQVMAKLAGRLPPGRNLVRTYRRKDGSTFPVLIEDRLLKNERGEITGIRCTIQDITERKRVEEFLRRSEEEAQHLARENEAMAKIGQIIGSTMNDEEVYGRFSAEMRELIPFDRIAINLIDPEYNTLFIPYAAGLSVSSREVGKIVPLAGTGVEWVKQNRSSLLIQEENREEARSRFPGLSPVFEGGFRSIMLVPLISKDQVIGVLNFQMTQPNSYTHKDLILAERVCNQIAGAIANAQLLAELKRTGEKLRHTQEILETRVKERTEDLLKARDAAEAANRAKSDFLANMSHELRTPLNHIIGFTELVVDGQAGELNETQVEYLGDVLGSSRHLLSLINDILDLSKVEAGKLQMEVGEVFLPALLQNSFTMIKEKAMKHGIQLQMEIDGIPERVRGDERKLKQILYNILSNAVKFTPDGGIVTLSAGSLFSRDHLWTKGDGCIAPIPFAPTIAGEWVGISIRDTGIGVKAEDLERIFAPFEQADNSASRRYQGTGLGLSLTRKLVELHGGKIWAESQGEGKGSRFTFVIPCKPTLHPADSQSHNEE